MWGKKRGVHHAGALLVDGGDGRGLSAHAARGSDVLLQRQLVHQIGPDIVFVAHFLQDGAVHVQPHGGLLGGELVAAAVVTGGVAFLVHYLASLDA